MAINPQIKALANLIRNAVYGKEVRKSIADSMELTSETTEETKNRQNSLEGQFQTVIEETTGKDVISAPEIIAARNGEANLKTRLDKEKQEVTAQLQQTEQNLNAQLAQTEEQLKLSDLYGKVYGSLSLYNKPSNFPLDIPFNVYTSASGKVVHNYDVAVNKVVATKRYYVDWVNGDNTNPGSESEPFKEIGRAFRYGDADEIIVKSGVYPWGNWSYSDLQLKDFNMIGEGDVYTGAHRGNLTWGLVDGHNYVYKTTATNVIEIVDINNGIDAPVFLKKVNSVEEVEITPSSYFINGSDIYVRTKDNSKPNEYFLCNLFNAATPSVSDQLYQKVYFENIKFTNTFEFKAPNSKLDVYAKNCDFAFGTSENALSFHGDVFAILQNCRAMHAGRDGFNYHVLNGKLPSIIEVDCEGLNNGRDGADQNNGSTMHDGGTILRVGGEYHNNHGPNVIDVNDGTQSLNIGVHAHHSTATSSLSNVDFRTRDDADMWLVNCVSNDSEYSTSTGSPARMYKENTLLLSEEVVI